MDSREDPSLHAAFFYKDSRAPAPNQPIRVGSCAVITYKDSILMERRRDCGKWALIGGKKHRKETFEDCVLREIKEETGVVLEKKGLKFLWMYGGRDCIASFSNGKVFQLLTAVYIIRLDARANVFASNESTAVKYINKSQLDRINIVETHAPILKKLKCL